MQERVSTGFSFKAYKKYTPYDLLVFLYFNEPVGRVKIQMTRKNTQRYYWHTKTSNKIYAIYLCIVSMLSGLHFPSFTRKKNNMECPHPPPEFSEYFDEKRKPASR